MELLHEGMAYAHPFIHSYGLFALFILVFLESLGAPVPGESALVASSALAFSGQLPLFGLYFTVVAAAVLGDNVGYLIGRKGGRPLITRYGKYVRLTPERLAWVENLYLTRGAIIVAGARFVVLLRQLNGLVAGSMHMNWATFLTANIIGAFLWAGVWTFGPYLLGSFVETAVH